MVVMPMARGLSRSRRRAWFAELDAAVMLRAEVGYVIPIR
jgi:hypothetical protein